MLSRLGTTSMQDTQTAPCQMPRYTLHRPSGATLLKIQEAPYSQCIKMTL